VVPVDAAVEVQMRGRQSVAGIFVVVMLALGAAVILHWKAVQPRRAEASLDPRMPEWRPATSKEYTDAKRSISSQLSDFQSGDFAKAAQYQSLELRAAFINVDNFRHEITSEYPQFCHFRSVTFGSCVSDSGGRHIRMEVMLKSPTGDKTHAAYFLQQENGVYRVEQVLSAPGLFGYHDSGFHDGGLHDSREFSQPGMPMGFGGPPPPILIHSLPRHH
jgi:hypothetical protein